jgi:hypothetical protein
MATAGVAKHHHHQSHLALSRPGDRRWRRRRDGVIRCSSPAQEFAALASVFRRRLVVGATTAAAAAVGANFGGVTSFLLGLSPELGRSLRLDVLYPVGGFTRCLDSDNGFGKRTDPSFPPAYVSALVNLAFGIMCYACSRKIRMRLHRLSSECFSFFCEKSSELIHCVRKFASSIA